MRIGVLILCIGLTLSMCYGFMRKVVDFRCVVHLFTFDLCMMRFSKNLGNQDYSRLSSLILA